MKKLFTLLTMLIVAITSSWATDIDVVEHAAHVYKTFPVNGGLFTITNTSSNMTISGNCLCMKSGTGKFQISTTVPGYTLKEIVFTDQNSSKNGGFTCEDGDYMTGPSSDRYTYTAPASTTAANFQLIGSGGTAQMKITSLVLTTSDNIVELYGFATSPSWSFTSNPTSDIAITTTNGSGFSVSSNQISWSNNSGTSTTTTKDLTITSASNIKYVTFVIKEDKIPANDKMILSGGTGTYANGVWTATEDSKTISFRQNTGGGIYVEKIFVALEAASINPSISASNVNIDKGATDAGEISFTINNPVEGGSVTNAESEETWLTFGDIDNENGKVPFTATANTTSSARVATVTLTYTYNTNETVTKDVTITQAPDVDGTAIIKATLTSKTGASVTGSIGGTYDVNVSSTTDETGGYKFGGKDQYIGLILASGNSFQAGDVINIHTTTTAEQGTIAIYDDDKATILYDTGVYKTSGTAGALENIDNKFVLPAAVGGKSTIYICRTNSNNWNGYVDFIEVTRPNATITLNAKGYATYSKATDFEFAGATAYKMALNENAKTITGTAVTGKIAAGEGILLKGEAGAKVSIIETTGAEALTGNDLKGTTTASGKATVPTYCYTLSGDTFKKFKGDAFNDNKAYLESENDLSGQSFEIIFDDQPTAISFVVEDDANVAVAPVKTIKNGQLFIGNYNVAGQQVK